MRSSIVVLGLVGVAAAGCGFHHSGETAGVDAAVDTAGSNCTTFASLVDTCQLAFDADLTVTGAATYDSGTQVLMIGGAPVVIAVKTTTIGGDTVDVISAHKVQLASSATLRATGPHALAIIADDSFTIGIDAQIDVSAGGAGAHAMCTSGAMAGQASGSGAAGGGGGGFGADGGNGGDGNADGSPSMGGAKGHAVATLPAGLRGGCPGANGGDGDAPGGVGGAGGGALYIAAASAIEFDSSAPINAGGAGGRGGQHTSGGDAGGGGGGAGGMVVVEAPHIVGIAATVAANGGGGGGGSDSGHAGGDGNPGSLTVDPADGGPGGTASGVDGGAGGSRTAPSGGDVTDLLAGGGGGGGGGVGIIRVLSPDFQLGVISPEPR